MRVANERLPLPAAQTCIFGKGAPVVFSSSSCDILLFLRCFFLQCFCARVYWLGDKVFRRSSRKRSRPFLLPLRHSRRGRLTKN
jgi:hypothetical protein